MTTDPTTETGQVAGYVRGQATYFDDGGELAQWGKAARLHLTLAVKGSSMVVDDAGRANLAATFFAWLPIAANTVIGRPAFSFEGAKAPGVTKREGV